MTPIMYVKRGNEKETTADKITQGLTFLGLSTMPNLVNKYQDNTGSDGAIIYSSLYARSTVTARFWLHFEDYIDYKLALHDIYKYFLSRDIYRIRTDAIPGKVMYLKPQPFEIKPHEVGSQDSLFQIVYDNPSGYKYSLFNSDVEKSYKSEAWGYGMNLLNGEDTSYHFKKQTSFKVYNASDITVDPYVQKHELKIIITNASGAFSIKNKTTGDEIAYRGQIKPEDELIFDGINAYLNGKISDNETDYSYLTLEPGWNEFQVNGASDIDITFSFPFIYLA